MNKTRLVVYSALALPFIASGLFLISMSPLERGGFVDDYRRTLGRLFSGEWSFSELTETDRDRFAESDNGRGRRSNRFDADTIFAALDKDGDGSLANHELGKRLRAGLSQDTNNTAATITSEEFRGNLQTARRLEASATHNGTASNSTATVEDASAVSPSNAPRLDADQLFATDHVVAVEIKIPAEDWQSLCNQSRSFRTAVENPLNKPYTYFLADVIVDGVAIKQIGIRKKGFIGSQDTIRPSLKIKFDEYVEQSPVTGLDRLTLNNNKQDRSLLSQSLTYHLFRKAGVAAPRCSYAAVTVNGRYLGIYSNVESVRKPFLQKSFGDDSGNLYEGTLADVYPKSIDWIEAKTNKRQGNRTKLIELAKLLDTSDNDFVNEIEDLVELDNFLRYWALESMINFWDGYTQHQNNYFIYANPTDGKFHFIPWGADSCFGGRPRFNRWGNNNSSVVRAVSILANRLYHTDGIPNRYRSTLEDLLANVWDEQELLQETERIEELLLDHIDFEQVHSIVSMQDVREFIRGRRENIMNELKVNWPVEVAATPRIPAHTVDMGTAAGTFSTNWGEGRGEQFDGAVAASITYDEETVEFTTVSAQLQSSDAGNSGTLGSSTGVVWLETVRDEWPLKLALILELDALQEVIGEKQKITVILNDDAPGSWGPKRGQVIHGELSLTEFGSEYGDAISGSFEVQIREIRGGFMDR